MSYGKDDVKRSFFFFFKQKTAYEMLPRLEFRRVLFRSRRRAAGCRSGKEPRSSRARRAFAARDRAGTRRAPRRGRLGSARAALPRRSRSRGAEGGAVQQLLDSLPLRKRVVPPGRAWRLRPLTGSARTVRVAMPRSRSSVSRGWRALAESGGLHGRTPRRADRACLRAFALPRPRSD